MTKEEQIREEVEKLRAITDRELAKLAEFYAEQTLLMLKRLGLPAKPNLFTEIQSICEDCHLINEADVDTVVESLVLKFAISQVLQECQNI